MKKQVIVNEEVVEVDLVEQNSNFVLFKFNGEEYGVNLESSRDGKFILNYNNKNYKAINVDNSFIIGGHEIEVALPSKNRNKSIHEGHSGMVSPMPGKILKIIKKVGEIVKKGEPILIMEAMKMEHTIKASVDGKIEKMFYKVGDQVPAKVELVKIC
jgi:3-methylcrotonyl-CoA carboxylase alpha subunit